MVWLGPLPLSSVVQFAIIDIGRRDKGICLVIKKRRIRWVSGEMGSQNQGKECVVFSLNPVPWMGLIIGCFVQSAQSFC